MLCFNLVGSLKVSRHTYKVGLRSLPVTYFDTTASGTGRKLTESTIPTHRGLFEWTRVSCGINLAVGYFMKAIDTVLKLLKAFSEPCIHVVAVNSVDWNYFCNKCVYSIHKFTLNFKK